MNGAGCRTKGHNWEREVARRMATIFGEAKRGLSQSRGGTAEEPDVKLPGGVPLWIECKRGRRTNAFAALEQARTAARDPIAGIEELPVAICKDDHREPTATMYLADWEVLIREWWFLKQQAAHLAAALDEVTAEHPRAVVRVEEVG